MPLDVMMSWNVFRCHDVMVTSFDVMRLVLHAVQLVNGWGYIITDIKPRMGMKYFLYPYRLTVVQ